MHIVLEFQVDQCCPQGVKASTNLGGKDEEKK